MSNSMRMTTLSGGPRPRCAPPGSNGGAGRAQTGVCLYTLALWHSAPYGGGATLAPFLPKSKWGSILMRPLILAGVPLFALMAWGLAQVHAHPRAPQWVREHRVLRKALVEFRRFRQGAAALFHPRIVAVTLLLSSAYVITAGATLYIVFPAIGIPASGVHGV